MFTLLMTAIINGDKKETLRLLSLYPIESLPEFIKDVDNRAHHLIHYLARYNHVDALRYLRDKVPPEMFTQEVNQQTPLILAVKGGAREVVDYFETENIDHLNQHQREAFDKLPFSTDVDKLDILSPDSPLFCAVGAGNLAGLHALIPQLFADEIYQANPESPFNYLKGLLNIAIENKDINFLIYLATILSLFNPETKLGWLTEEFVTLLSIGSNCTTIEYIERNYTEPARVINLLFPYHDLELKKRLIFTATQKSCLKLLQALLAQLIVEEKIRKDILREIFRIAIGIHTGKQHTAVQFFQLPDILDVAAIACASYFNKYPALLAELLQEHVANGDIDMVEVFLKRISKEARSELFEHQLDNGWTLTHLAVYQCACDMVIMLRQFGASFESTSVEKVSVTQFAKTQAESAIMTRLAKINELEEQIKALEGCRKQEKKQKKINAIEKRQDEAKEEFEKFNQLSLEELTLMAVTAKNTPLKLLNQKLYFQVVGKITNGEMINNNDIAMLVSIVNNLRENGKGTEKKYIRGVFKVLVTLAKNDLDSGTRKIYRLLSDEITTSVKIKNLFEFLVHMTMLEYGTLLEDYETSLTHLDDISSIVNALEDKDVILAGANLPQVILTRLALNFCQSLRVSIPKETKELLRKSSADKTELRLNRDKEGFSLQSPLALLSLASPFALSSEALEKLWASYSVYKQDIENYEGVALPDELCQSALFRKIADRTYADIRVIYQWWCSVEKAICPEAFIIPLVENPEALRKIQNFLYIKSNTMAVLAKSAGALDEALKAESSPIIAKLKAEHIKTESFAKEIEAALKAAEQKKDVVLSVPPINPLIFWAIEQRDSGMVLRLLEAMDKDLLFLAYQDDFTVADYLAEQLTRTGQLHALRYLFSKLSEEKQLTYRKRLLSIAKTEYQLDVIEYLGGNRIDAISLFKTSLDNPVAPEVMLMRILRVGSTDSVPVLVHQIENDELLKILPDVLHVAHGRFDNLLDVLKPIIDKLGREELAKAAIREGYLCLMLDLLKSYGEKDERILVACELLRYMAAQYKEEAEYDAVIIMNARHKGLETTSKMLANQMAARTKTRGTNKNIKEKCLIGSLARWMASDFHAYPEKLNSVLRLFYECNHHGGMRDLLSNLPLAVKAAAINYVPPQEGDKLVLSLLHTAIDDKKSEFWYLLMVHGANSLQKCNDKADERLIDLINPQHGMGSKKSFSQDSLLAEQYLNTFMTLLNNLMQGEKLSQDDIQGAVSNIKKYKIKMPLDKCLAKVWETVKWCIEHYPAITDFDSALRLAETLMDTMDGNLKFDYIRYAALAFALGHYEQALIYVKKLEEAAYQKFDLSKAGIVQLTTAKLTLILLSALRCRLPAHLIRFYLEKWDSLCNKQLIGDGFLPFMRDSELSITPQTLKILLEKLIAFTTPQAKRHGVVNSGRTLAQQVGTLELFTANRLIIALLIDREKVLFGSQSEAAKIKNDELFQLFYISANRIIYLVRKSMDMLSKTAPEEAGEFFRKVEEFVNDSQKILSNHNEERNKRENSETQTHARKDKSTFQYETVTVSKTKSLRNPGWGVRMTPEQLLEILPPVTYTIESPKPKLQMVTPEKALIGQTLKTESSNPHKPKKRPRKKKTKKTIDSKDFPVLPSQKPVVNEIPEVVQTPNVEVAVQDDYQTPVAPFDVIPRDIIEILRFFGARDDNEFNAYLTGGAVRDCLMRRPISGDYDVVVDFNPAILEVILQRKFGIDNVKKKGMGEKHSWRVKYNGLKIDFCCAKDAKPDFTCNAIKWHPDIRKKLSDDTYGDAPGNLVEDKYGGVQDIADKKLRFVDASSESFAKNQLLIFRDLRFERDLNFIADDAVAKKRTQEKNEIEQLPFRIENKKLKVQYGKMLSIFKNDSVILHEVLKRHGLLAGMSMRVDECQQNERLHQLQNSLKQ